MNKRYEKLSNKLLEWFKGKEQDELIIRSLYTQVYLRENTLVDRNEDLKNETKYSNLSNDDFVSLFKTENFTPLEKDELKHLFQELHNRYMTSKGYEVTRNVAVVNDENTSAYGYVCYSDDLLYINKHAIDKTKTTEPTESYFNKNNLGNTLMFIIMHESQHVTQYETTIDFALNSRQSKANAFLGAMGIIKNTNFSISNMNNDDYIDEWKNNYDFRYVEHNANYSAFKAADKLIPESEKTGKAFDEYTVFSTLLALRSHGNDKAFVEKRIKKMEEVAKREIEYFSAGTEDCPIKDEILNTVNAYMEVDENGNSLFRSQLRRQITEMAKASKKAKDNLFYNKQENNKENENNEEIQFIS